MQKSGVIYVLAAGFLWGCTGFFVRTLTGEFGFTTFQVVTLRLVDAASAFLILSLIKGKDTLKVKLKHLPILFCSGFFGVFMLAVTYFSSMQCSSLSLAAILMYTAPIFVMLASIVLFKEKLTFMKILSLILALIGLVFVSGILKGDANVTFLGVVLGILSGITYGSYSIFGKYALKHYKGFTVTAWAFIFAGLSSLFIGDLPDMAQKIATQASPKLIILLLSMGVVTAFMPFLLYTLGLSRLDASKAIILASVEPLVATVLGIVVFGEQTDVFSIIGIFVILVAVVLASLKKE